MRNNEFHGKYSLRYNGSERICSRLGDRTFSLSSNVAFTPQTQQRLATRIMQVDQDFRAELLELVEAGDVPVEFPNVLNLITLLPAGSNANSHSHSNPNTDIFYYHTNHLGSTAFVTDNNATITQGFLYAPFGEITTEYVPMWQNSVLPKYTFNAKELDEETGMYYYEARYYKPPVFTSRDPMFEKYFWMTPYAYCANNSMKYVDPTGCEFGNPRSRIEYRGNGTFGINKNNLNRATRNRLAVANANPACWSYNKQTGQTDIGVNTTVAQIQISSQISTQSTAGVDPKHTSVSTVSERIAKSTGQPDKRSSRTISTLSSGGGSKALGIFSLAVDIANISYSYWDMLSVNGDMNAIAKQSALLQQAFDVVTSSNKIPYKYQNTNDLGAIINYVFQGVNNTGDKNITTIGNAILKNLNRYDKETRKYKPLIEE